MFRNNEKSLRVRLLELLEDGPRTERTLVVLVGSSPEIVREELRSMNADGMVIAENVILPVWRITMFGLRILQ